MRLITFDTFCHKCKYVSVANGYYASPPSHITVQLEEATQSSTCSVCGERGALELLAISDPLQNEHVAPILVKTILNRVRSWHLQKGFDVSTIQFKHISVVGGFIEAELEIYKGTRLQLTFAIRANENKLKEIMVSGVPTAILNCEDLFDNDNFFGVPLLGYSVNEDDPGFWILVSVVDVY